MLKQRFSFKNYKKKLGIFVMANSTKLKKGDQSKLAPFNILIHNKMIILLRIFFL